LIVISKVLAANFLELREKRASEKVLRVITTNLSYAFR
jgi:hypothetical protein